MCTFRQLSGLLAHTWPICGTSKLTGSPRQIKETGMGSAVSQPATARSCGIPLTAACHASDLPCACWLQGGYHAAGRGCQKVRDTPRFGKFLFGGLIWEVCSRISKAWRVNDASQRSCVKYPAESNTLGWRLPSWAPPRHTVLKPPSTLCTL